MQTLGQRTLWWGTSAILGIASMMHVGVTNAQFASTYIFTATTGTYTEIPAGAPAVDLAGTRVDSHLSAAQPIGFTFVYEGVGYTQFKMGSNGFISLNTAGTAVLTANDLSAANATSRPIIAPLWDDLDGNVTTPLTSVGRYTTTGTAPNRVLTVEWRYWQWNWNATGNTISFQAVLYETTNVIEFIYREEVGALNAPTATIGIGSATGSGTGSYLNLASIAAPAVSSTATTNNLAVKPATGTVYRFTPPPPPACPAPTTATGTPTGPNTANVSWTCAACTGTYVIEYGPAATFTVPGTGATAGTNGTVITSAVTSAAISGLDPSTQYRFFVRQNCGIDGYSTNSTAQTFTTPCVALTAPWSENFDALVTVGTNSFPACWTEEAGDWTTANAATDTRTDPRSAPNYLRTSFLTVTNEFMWSPPFDLNSGNNYGYSFWYMSDGYTGWTVEIYVNTLPSSVGATQLGATVVVPDNGNVSTAYSQLSRNYAPGADGVYYFGIRVQHPTTTPWYLGFDDFSLISDSDPPACTTYSAPLEDESIAAGVGTTLTWNAAPGATVYDVYFDTNNPPTTLVSDDQAGTTYATGALATNTVYYWQIIPANGAGAASGCAVASFNTNPPACLATPTAPVNGGQSCVGTVTTLSWPASLGATGYDVYLDAGAGPATTIVSSNQAGTTFAAGTLAAGPFAWRVVPKNANGDATGCPNWTFTVSPAPAGDTFATAQVISTLPFSASGLTVQSAQCFTNTNALQGNERFFQLTTSECTTSLTVQLCETTGNGDTYLRLYAANQTTVVATDDDTEPPGCLEPLSSSLTNVAVTPNTVYYISVEAFSATYNEINVMDLSVTANCFCFSPSATLSAVDQNCGAGTFTLDVDVTSTGSTPSVNIVYTVNGGTPVTVNAGVGVSTIPAAGSFAQGDVIDVEVRTDDNGCVVELGEFTDNCPIQLVCGTTLPVNYCYKNNETKTWTFTTVIPSETVTLTFVSGTIDEVGDVVRIYDGTDNSGTLLASSSVSNLAGLTATSTGQSIYMEVISDASNSCQDAGQTSWLFEVECTAGCTDPDGTVTQTTDCGTYTFSLDVEILSAGDALGGTTSVSYTVNGGAATVIPGLVEFDVQPIGPFAIGDVVNVFLLHENDSNCDRNLGSFTQSTTFCFNDDPCVARPVVVNPNYSCGDVSPGTVAGATASGTVSTCSGTPDDDVWYRFVATATTHRIQLLNISGSVTDMYHSLFTGPDCNSLSLVAGSCSDANTSNPAGLVLGETYWLRVYTWTSTGGQNTTFNVCVSAPPLLDVDATTLQLPSTVACYGATETVSVNVQNTSLYTLDMSVAPVTVDVAVTGAATVNLTGTVNSGTLAPGATVVVPMSTTLDMSAFGSYTFNGSAVLAGDGNAANNSMTAATRTNVATAALPQTNDFTGFSGTNLTTVFPNWREGAGAAQPAGTTSAWTSSAAAQQTQLASGVSARINLVGTARNEWLVGPRVLAQAGTVARYRIAITDVGNGNVDPAGMQGTDDRIILRVSTDCGVTWSDVFTHNAGNTVGITNSLVQQQVDLSTYAGQEIIVAFFAVDGPIDDVPSYDFHVDDISIENIAVCTGAPVAGTAASSAPTPVCAPASSTLSVSGQSTDGGVVITWLRSNTPGGPYTTNVGSGTSIPVSGLEASRYYVASVKCLLTNDSTLSNEVAVIVTPSPSASASAGTACSGQDLELTGTTNFGTTFAWSGPASFSSLTQNATVTNLTQANAGTYTFTATANGCSRNGTVVVQVNASPTIVSLTADPNPVCSGSDVQLEALATAPGYSMSAGGSSFIDISGTGTAIPGVGDDSEHNITIPGGFTFNGVSYTDARVGANGVIVFGATTGEISLTNAALPTGSVAAGNAFLAPWWDDIDNDAGGGQIFIGQSGNLLIAQWNNWGRSAAVAGQVITFQVQLDQVTGEIFFVYPDVIFGGTQAAANDNGLNATVGIQWANAVGSAIQYSFNEASLTDGQVIAFTPNTPTYSWSPATFLTATNIADPVAENVNADVTYNLSVTAGGCTSTQDLALVANAPIQANEASIVPATPSFCTGSDVTLTATPLGGGGPFLYTWTDPNNVSGTPTANADLVVNVPGTWSLLIEDGCGSQATTSVVVNEFPVPNVTVGSNSPVCSGDDILLNATSTVPGSSFLWTGPNGFTSTDEDPVISAATLSMTGSYSVTATANGCSSAPAATVVQVNVTPTTPVIDPSVWSLCPGGSVELSATATAVTALPFTGGLVNIPAGQPGTTTGIGGPYPSTIAVAGLPASGVIVKQVLLNGMVHTFSGDLDILLQSPTGTNVVLMSDIGGVTDLVNDNLVLQDGAPAIPATVGSGTYSPTADGTSDTYVAPGPGAVLQTNPTLASFTGNMNGTWNLFVVDDANGDFGSMDSWAIVFEYNDVSFTWSPSTGLNTTTGPVVTATPTATETYTVTASNGGCSSTEDITVYIGTNDLTLEFQTDGAPNETTWEIRTEGTNELISEGGPLVAPFGVETDFACLPDGCYVLRVLDSAGDGMTTGGYILRTTGTNERIIDNRNNFSTGSVSAISGGQGFCLPMSNDKVIFTSCDKLDWVNGQYVVATPNAAVSAEWVPNGANNVQDANSGYEFWIFDPNGSYSYRRFRSHNVSDGFGPASATRAAHMRMNNWAVANQVPANVLMNVRVRARVNGVNGEFGPACRLAVNPTLAACPQTQLMNIPGDPNFSCGATRQWGNGNYVHARPVSGANRYQFRFSIPAEGFTVTRTATTYFTQLNWPVLPLQDGKTYDVEVRISKDGGATWCSNSTPWGPVCLLTIDNTPANSGNQNFAAEGMDAELRMFPNPNRGDVLNFSLSAIEEGVSTVSVDIYDLAGTRVSTRTIAVSGSHVNTVLDLNGELAAGMYLVNITAGETVYTERLVIQP
jgi:subtilisin-like proprotein convertase family protein